ncbi:MAG: GDP-mannose 4,6-dehydratase [Thermoplasmatota archaeon]
MKTVMVTGGAGFLGSHLVDLLLENGFHVYIIDDLSIGKAENLSRWTSIDDEFEDLKDLYKYSPGRRPRYKLMDIDITRKFVNNPWLGEIDQGQIDCIFHLAARMDVMSSFDDPFDDGMRNYIGTLNVLEYARKVKCDKVVLRSSFTVYSDKNEQPVSEDALLDPISPYALHKYASEKVLNLYNDHYGMRNASFRLFNMYGPRQNPESIYAGVVMRFLDQARKGEPLTVYGTGEQTRDFLYVKDAVRAMFEGYIQDATGTYNVGTGQGTTINHLAKIVRKVVGKDIDILKEPLRKGEVVSSMADISKLKRDLSFETYVDLEQGLKETLEWMNENL